MQSLVRPANLFSGFFLIMDIQAASDVSFECAVRRIAWHATVKNPAILATVMAHSVLHLEGFACVEAAYINLQTAVEIFGVHIFGPTVPIFLFEGTPDKVQPTFVEVVAKLVRPRHPDHDRRSISDRFIKLLVLSQNLVGFAAIYVSGRLPHVQIQPSEFLIGRSMYIPKMRGQYPKRDATFPD